MRNRRLKLSLLTRTVPSKISPNSIQTCNCRFTTSFMLPMATFHSPSTTGDPSSSNHTLSKCWAPERRFSAFFNRGRPVYNDQHHVIFCIHNDSVHIIDPTTLNLLAIVEANNDGITAFAVSSSGDTVVVSCRSLLIRVFNLNWPQYRRNIAAGILVDEEKRKESDNKLESNAAFSRDNVLPITLVKSWKGPRAIVLCMTISPGTAGLVAVGSTDGSIYLYNIIGGYCTHTFTKHSDKIGILKFHPSRLLLFSTSADGEIRIHDLYRHICIAQLKDHLSSPTDLDFIATTESKNELLGGIVTSSRDKVINVWSLDSLDTQLSEEVRKGVIALSPKQKKSCEYKIYAGKPPLQIEATLGQRVIKQSEPSKKIRNNDEADNESHIVNNLTEMSKSAAQFWIEQGIQNREILPVHQISSSEPIETLLCISTRTLSECQVLESGSPISISNLCPWCIITGGVSGNLILWNPITRKQLAVLRTPHTDRGTIIYLSSHQSKAGRSRIISAAEDHNIIFWDLASLSLERLLLGNATELIHCQFVPVPEAHHSTYLNEQRHLSSTIKSTDCDTLSDIAGENYIGRTTKASSMEESGSLEPRENADNDQDENNKEDAEDVSTVHSSDCKKSVPYERVLVLRSDADCTLLELSRGRAAASLLHGHSDTVLTADVSPEGCWVVTGGKDHSIRIWSSKTEQCVATIDGHTAPVVSVQTNKRLLKSISCTCLTSGPETSAAPLPTELSAGGMFVVSVCLEGILKLWKVDRNDLRNTIKSKITEEQSKSSHLLSFSTVDSENKEHHIIEPHLRIKNSFASIVAHEKEINALTISPNDKLIATGSSDKSIKIWNVPDLALLGVCKGHSRAVWSIQFSPVEKVIVSGSGDQTIKLWNLKDFSCLKTFQGHSSSVLGVAFLTLGMQIMSCSGDGLLKLWNIRTSECIASLDNHNSSKVWSLAMNTDRTRMLSCSSDNQLLIWHDTTEEAERALFEQNRIEAAEVLEIESLARQGQTLKALTLSLKHRRQYQTRNLLRMSCTKALFREYDDEVENQVAPPTGIAKMLFDQKKAQAIVPISSEELGKWISDLSEDQLKILIEFIVKWNSNGQTSNLANTLLQLVLQHSPHDKLLRIEGFPSLITSFLAYSPRHSSRLSALIQRTFILDMILFTSGVKSISDAPDLPSRKPCSITHHEPSKIDESLKSTAVPLSLGDAYDIIFE